MRSMLIALSPSSYHHSWRAAVSLLTSGGLSARQAQPIIHLIHAELACTASSSMQHEQQTPPEIFQRYKQKERHHAQSFLIHRWARRAVGHNRRERARAARRGVAAPSRDAPSRRRFSPAYLQA